MISQAPHMTLQNTSEELENSVLGRACAFALFSIVVFGGWLATWALIFGFGLVFMVVAIVGLVALAMVPVAARRKSRTIRRPRRNIQRQDRIGFRELVRLAD